MRIRRLSAAMQRRFRLPGVSASVSAMSLSLLPGVCAALY
jgi:hypothetical protein